MGILDRMFKEQLEYHNGRIHFRSWTWVFDPTKRELKTQTKWVSTRKDASGQSMTLVKRRGVFCSNPEMGDRYPKSCSARTNTWYVRGTVCRACEHHRKGGLDGLRYPHCAWARRKRGGTSRTAKMAYEMIEEATRTAAKMMGQ